MSKKLLIVEESLRDLKAHWFEYIKHIAKEADNLGWSTQVACHKAVDQEIKKELKCLPVFKHARYLDSGKKKLPGEHYYGFVLHSIRAFRAITKTIKHTAFDFVFCPTVTVHHLLAWYVLLKIYPQQIKKLCLFFVTNPGMYNSDTQKISYPKSSKILGYLLAKFKPYVHSGQVVMGVETKAAKTEFEHISGVKFQLFPHPVPFNLEQEQVLNDQLHLACYGFARYEKGSDLLQEAILEVLSMQEVPKAHFSIQWTDDFVLPNGELCPINEALKTSNQVSIIDKPLNSSEYQSLLKRTDIMLLPYRNASYYARVSRVAIEATNMGIPCVFTKGGWLQETISTYGAGIGIRDESVDDLVMAIKEMISNFNAYKKQATEKKAISIAYFEPINFCEQLLNGE
ncbi:glycosyltransferase [Winogradskyella aurantia]|uniref:Glycosyl transferase family 1 domain-containing protein n=1 Tax=Winogradskyella aurantia TaxID=1915063 RepID=A0A265UVB0_9FLAO|nr:glycosyltransferase [Winogradskyella aurantia]OZV69238.1 hypothetical protein CA834_07215 [Winogradskyella aurantia]